MTTPAIRLQSVRNVSLDSYKFFGADVLQLLREEVVAELRRLTTCYPHVSVSVKKDRIFHSDVFVVTATAYVTESDVEGYPELKEGGWFA